MSTKNTLPPVWRAMADHAGAVSKLADSLGVSRFLVYKWAHGERKGSRASRAWVNAWARRRGLTEPFREAR